MSFLIIGQRTRKETKNNKHHQNFSMMWNYSVSYIWEVFSLEQLCIQTKIITVLFVLLLLCIIWYGNQEKDMGLNCLYDINDESRNVLVQKLVLDRIQASPSSNFRIELKLGSPVSVWTFNFDSNHKNKSIISSK